VEPAPKPWAIQQQESPGPVVEVPLGGPGSNDVEAMYRSMWTGNPVVNGYSGFGPPWYGPVELGLRIHDPALLQELSARGIRQLVVNTTAEQGEGWLQYLASRPDIALVGDDGAHRLYRLPAAPPIADRHFGPPVRIAGMTANVGSSRLPAMTDGDLTTRWETGPQRGVEVLTIDLGSATRVAAIVLALGPFATDAPRDLVIEVSDDGQVWAEVWHDAGASRAFRAVFQDPVRVPATFDIGDRTTRFLRLRQLGKDETYYWSVAELSVLAPADR
jgi:F5/8 type C domain-containing protein